jgi:hypothetical protein
MDDYPLTRGLLAELCGLDAEDRQLPLEVIANLHRRQLRAPLSVIPHLDRAQEKVHALAHAVDILDALYPHLAYGNIYRESTGVGGRVAVMDEPGFYMEHMMRGKQDNNVVILDMITAQVDSSNHPGVPWHSYSAPWLLYEMTLPHGGVDVAADRLEIILGIHPSVKRSLLELAMMSRDEAEALDWHGARRREEVRRVQAQIELALNLISPAAFVQRVRRRLERRDRAEV